MTLIVSKSQAERIGRLFIGVLLLLPALLCFGGSLWLPLWRTLMLALGAGLPRVLAPWSDPHLAPACWRSGLIALVRIVATVLPAALARGQGATAWRSAPHPQPLSPGERGNGLRPTHPRGRIATVLVLCLGLALSSPVGLALLWRGAVRDLPQPLRSLLSGDPLPFTAGLGLEFITALGLGGGLAVLAMLAVKADPLPPTEEGMGVRDHHTRGAVLALAALAALESGLDAAALPLALTDGIPDGRTAPLALHLFSLAFRDRQVPQAAAEALPLLALCLTLGLAFGILSERWGLSLRYARRPSPPSPLPWSFKSGQAATNPLSPLGGEGRVRGDRYNNKSSASCQAQSSPPSPLSQGEGSHISPWLLPSRRQGNGTRPSIREPLKDALPPLFAAFLVALPVLLLYLWGLGEWWLSPGRPLTHAASLLQMELALLDGSAVPLGTILLVQLPAAYLAALSLTRVRPFGERGSRAASAMLIASGFIPQVVVAIGLYDLAQPMGLAGLAVPLAAGPASYYVFRLGLAGSHPLTGKRDRGENRLLPLIPLALALALLCAGQRLLWPLVVLTQRNLFTLSMRLLALQRTLADHPAVLIAAAWLVLTVWAGALLVLWWVAIAINWGRWELHRGQRALDRHKEQPDNAQHAQGSIHRQR